MPPTSKRSVVSRPGVSSDTGRSGFISPFQPPPSVPDFTGDLALLDPAGVFPLVVGDAIWRVRRPGPEALKQVADVAEASGAAQLAAIHAFMVKHMVTEDFNRVVGRLLDPDDPFTAADYMELYRLAVTVGTARPFLLLSGLPARRSSPGGLSARSLPSRASRRRSRR
jgi:hypothetical protein